jgi:hypothetical protein
MKYSVFVTSAVNATFSMYKPEDRLKQTLATIASVRKFLPEAEITIVECSVPAINADYERALADQADHFVSLSNDPNVVYMTENGDRGDVTKNLTEAMVLRKLMAVAIKREWFADSDRIFKISGRYQLNEKFDITAHTDLINADRFVFRKKNLSQFRPEHTGVPLQYQTRLYSFAPALLPRYTEVLDNMVETMQTYFNQGKYIDIEHLWWKLLSPTEITELDKIGVSGNIAPNGQVIDD